MERFTVKNKVIRDEVLVTVWDNKRNKPAISIFECKRVHEPSTLEQFLNMFLFREVTLKQKLRKAMYKMQLIADKMNDEEWGYDRAERTVKEIEGENKDVKV